MGTVVVNFLNDLYWFWSDAMPLINVFTWVYFMSHSHVSSSRLLGRETWSGSLMGFIVGIDERTRTKNLSG